MPESPRFLETSGNVPITSVTSVGTALLGPQSASPFTVWLPDARLPCNALSLVPSLCLRGHASGRHHEAHKVLQMVARMNGKHMLPGTLRGLVAAQEVQLSPLAAPAPSVSPATAGSGGSVNSALWSNSTSSLHDVDTLTVELTDPKDVEKAVGNMAMMKIILGSHYRRTTLLLCVLHSGHTVSSLPWCVYVSVTPPQLTALCPVVLACH
jgi:hypothetical protein